VAVGAIESQSVTAQKYGHGVRGITGLGLAVIAFNQGQYLMPQVYLCVQSLRSLILRRRSTVS
jgi:hypothetical protein